MVEGCIKGLAHIMTAYPFTSDQKIRSRDRIYRVLKLYLATQFATENLPSIEDANSGKDYKGPQLGRFAIFLKSSKLTFSLF
jgi:hypothetical protein